MPYLLITHTRHPLAPGRLVIGTSADASPRIEVPGHVGPLVELTVSAGGMVTVRRLAAGIEMMVDDAELGEQPLRLTHGAKITVGPARMIFGDDGAGGATDKRVGLTDEMIAAIEEPLPAEPTTDSGGVLHSLSDGRSYTIPPEGLELGRDPNCDVVLTAGDASRWHASVAPSLLGYVIRDSSSNGVLVNGRRIAEQRVLGRGDVITIGDQEFRFEAAAARYEPSTSLRLAALAGPGEQVGGAGSGESTGGASDPPTGGDRAESAASAAVRAAGASTSSTNGGQPASSLPLLGSLEVITAGLLQGRRFRIERPLTHIGRGAHNEVVLGDESVSGSHATLQRRAQHWVIVDQRSTNGTYVDGERIEGERVLPGACELRFGGIRLVFRPLAGAPKVTDSTRGIVGIALGEGDPSR